MCPDDQIVLAIIVHIARRADGDARIVSCRCPVDHKAANAACNRREVNWRCIIIIPAKHHIACAGVIDPIRVGVPCPDDQIVQTIAVDIARRADGAARTVQCRCPVDHKAANAACNRREVNCRCIIITPAKHHIARAGSVPVRVGVMCPHDQIDKTIAVDIARRADGKVRKVTCRCPVDHKAANAVYNARKGRDSGRIAPVRRSRCCPVDRYGQCSRCHTHIARYVRCDCRDRVRAST